MSSPFCPRCDSSKIRKTVTTNTWDCYDCGLEFSDPVYREPRRENTTLRGAAEILNKGTSIDVCPRCGEDAFAYIEDMDYGGIVKPCGCVVPSEFIEDQSSEDS